MKAAFEIVETDGLKELGVHRAGNWEQARKFAERQSLVTNTAWQIFDSLDILMATYRNGVLKYYQYA